LLICVLLLAFIEKLPLACPARSRPIVSVSRSSPTARSELIADVDGIVPHARDREVLSEHATGQLHFRKLFAPERIVVGWVDIDSFLWPPMHLQICLFISLQIESPERHASCHRFLEDPSQHLSPLLEYCSGPPDID
jgi:hypothetical protein